MSTARSVMVRLLKAVTAWNSAKVSLAAVNAGTLNAAVTAWNSAKVSLAAVNAGTLNAAVTAWNSAKVSLTAVNAGTINAAVTAFNSRTITLRAVDTAPLNAAVAAFGSGAGAALNSVAVRAPTILTSGLEGALKSVFGTTVSARLASTAEIYFGGTAKPFSTRLNEAFDQVFSGSAGLGFGGQMTALVAANDNLRGALGSLSSSLTAYAAELAADRQAAAIAEARKAYEAEISAVGTAAKSQAAATLGADIGGPEQSYYGRRVAVSAKGAGEITGTELINSSNGVERNVPRATALAEMLGGLGGQVQAVIGGSLPAYTVYVSDHNMGSEATDEALWLVVNGKRVGYAGVSDYTQMARLYLGALPSAMTGVPAQYKSLLAGADWSNIPSGMAALAEAVARLKNPVSGYAYGGTVTAGIYDVDSVPAWLAGGEFVVTAPSNNNETRAALDFINRTGRLPQQAPITVLAPGSGNGGPDQAAIDDLVRRLDALLTSSQADADGAADQRDELRAEVAALRREITGFAALVAKFAGRAA